MKIAYDLKPFLPKTAEKIENRSSTSTGQRTAVEEDSRTFTSIEKSSRT